MYLTGYVLHPYYQRLLNYTTSQHNIVPEPDFVSEITHVALAFMRPNIFNSATLPVEFPLFTTVDAVRVKFAAETKIMVAIGGWGDTEGFSIAARTEESRMTFAENVRIMIEQTGADGQ